MSENQRVQNRIHNINVGTRQERYWDDTLAALKLNKFYDIFKFFRCLLTNNIRAFQRYIICFSLINCVFTRWGYPSAHTFPLFLIRRVHKATRVTRVGGLRYLRARITLAGELTFSRVETSGRVNPPTWVNLLLASSVTDLSCPGLWGNPTREILLVNVSYRISFAL